MTSSDRGARSGGDPFDLIDEALAALAETARVLAQRHAVGLDPTGERLHDAPLPNSEPKLRALFDKLAANRPPLVVVDQPATIGALPVAVARAAGHQVAY